MFCSISRMPLAMPSRSLGIVASSTWVLEGMNSPDPAPVRISPITTAV